MKDPKKSDVKVADVLGFELESGPVHPPGERGTS
jgi:hypothetical protein